MSRRFLLLASSAILLAGCGSASDAPTDPVSAAANAALPLPRQSQYTYWRRIEGTKLYEAFTSDHPLTAEEQQKLGIVPPSGL